MSLVTIKILLIELNSIFNDLSIKFSSFGLSLCSCWQYFFRCYADFIQASSVSARLLSSTLHQICLFVFDYFRFALEKRSHTLYAVSSQLACHYSVFKLVIVRIVFVGGGVTLVYFCLAYLPVSIVTTLFNLGPIFIFFIEAISYKVLTYVVRRG